MKKIFLLLALLPIQLLAQTNLHYQDNRTLTYTEIVDAYKKLNEDFPRNTSLEIEGTGDNGRPIYAFVIEPDASRNIVMNLLINNGIHAGEPDGIDASLLFAQKVLHNRSLYSNVRFIIIPAYNVDGVSTQSCCTRANQNGPENQGFRGNARNLDLNRDFIKADASNTKAFYTIFHKFKPQVFIDNHVSNGADYQYNMTLISTQHNKLGPVLGKYLKNEMEPALFKEMDKRSNAMIPYVNTIGEIPDSGLVGFLEGPRFATGYAALFHCIGFVAETHMLKPYPVRVEATLDLLESLSKYCNEHHIEIMNMQQREMKATSKQISFPISWKLNPTKKEMLVFKGYQAGYKKSGIGSHDRLFYDRSKPFTKKIPFLNTYNVTDSVNKPTAFVIPQAWHQLIDLLKLNKIEMTVLPEDTLLKVHAYYIDKYKTGDRPYEGHYLHYQTQVQDTVLVRQLFEGDVIVPTNQAGIRFIMETLSPQAPDSYFNWNFFDSMLQQKEYFSNYVFEDTAEEILQKDPNLKARFEEKKKNDLKFSQNSQQMLEYIYTNSQYYETTHNLYPIFRLQ